MPRSNRSKKPELCSFEVASSDASNRVHLCRDAEYKRLFLLLLLLLSMLHLLMLSNVIATQTMTMILSSSMWSEWDRRTHRHTMVQSASEEAWIYVVWFVHLVSFVYWRQAHTQSLYIAMKCYRFLHLSMCASVDMRVRQQSSKSFADKTMKI